MSESTTTVLRIGGNPAPEVAGELLNLLEESAPDNQIEFDSSNRIEAVYWTIRHDDPAITKITEFCRLNSLPYRVWVESTGMVDFALSTWTPGDESERLFLSNRDERQCFTIDDLMDYNNRGLTLSDFLRDFSVEELPAFVGTITPTPNKTESR